ncbi:MAG: PIG-L deacetylase family protein [Myxococcota bacterium]|nr:PIG-L deacetylase family protein [Myxococcota bacterium]
MPSRSAEFAEEILQAERVLCVQPHYDDNDIAAGGTFAQLADAGIEVHYLTVTDNIAGVLDPDLSDAAALAQTRAEQDEAGREIGVHAQYRLDLPDAGEWSEVELRTRVIEHIRRVRPDYVFTCDPWLPHEAHRDHLRTGIAVGEAVMFHGMPRFETLPEVDDGYVAHNIRGLVLYFTTDSNTAFDVSETHARKHRAIDAYRAQLQGDSLAGLHAGIGLMEQRWGEPEGFAHAEVFKLLRPGQLHVGLAPSR